MSAIAQKLESLVGSSSICVWENLELEVQNRIGAALADGDCPECIAYPTTVEELSEIMACAHQHRWRVLPLGSGSKLKWGGLAQGIQLGISTERLNRLIDHADGDLTVTAEAGMKLADLQLLLAKAGQFLALNPAYATATLGGIIATADSGALRHRYGGVRDMLLGIEFVRADGAIAKAGGRVVKNVAGYDLMKLFTGSWGTLGILTQVTFRVYPIPEASETVVLTGSTSQIAQAAETLLASALTPTAVELLAASSSKRLNLGDGLALIARFQSIPVGVAEQAGQLAKVGEALGLTVARLSENSEAALWNALRETWEAIATTPTTTCKIGVMPSNAAVVLDKVDALMPDVELGLVHAGSGLGLLRFGSAAASSSRLQEIRKLCQVQGGFLSILEAPMALKQQVDVWGYAGNALHLMQGIKRQFDPENLLSPSRFVV
jgi:glycolate oxidase FAD binding subunit